jgi:hypothetical protein
LDGALSAAAEVESVPDDPAEIARRLRDDGFAGVIASPDVVGSLLDRFRRDELIIGHIETGLAVLDTAGIVLWANRAFRDLAGNDPTGRPLLAALGTAGEPVGCECHSPTYCSMSKVRSRVARRLSDRPNEPRT